MLDLKTMKLSLAKLVLKNQMVQSHGLMFGLKTRKQILTSVQMLKDSHPFAEQQKKKGDTNITIPEFHKVHVFDEGEDITHIWIVAGKNKNLTKIKCVKAK